jgi:peroxiredoxin
VTDIHATKRPAVNSFKRLTSLAVMVFVLCACQPLASMPARPGQNPARAQGASAPAVSAGLPLRAGARAPDFRLAGAGGATLHLADTLHAGGTVMLIFYTSRYCRVCLDVLSTLETDRPAWQTRGARLIAIARQSVAEAAASAQQANAGYAFLADSDGQVARSYGVWPLLPGQTKNRQSPMMVFILEPSGVIRWSGSMFVGGQPAVETVLGQLPN